MPQERKKRARAMLKELRRLFPGVQKTSLQFHAPFELLVAVILSAQCTDKKVNEVTARLFKKYRTLDDYASASAEAFGRDIRETGYFMSKANYVIGSARMLKKRFHSRIPKTMEEILMLPGVGRKTANVVLGNLYGAREGVAVDTHVKRFAAKFDLSHAKTPAAIEQDLMAVLLRKDWTDWTNYLIEYGRKICPARKHSCEAHPLTLLYPEAAARWPKTRFG